MSTQTGTNSLTPSTVIGDYRVMHFCAAGGMGEVYKVENPLLEEVFALKMMNLGTQAGSTQTATQRFLTEARITARLRHSNIVTLHTLGVDPALGRLYIVMDYVGVSPARRKEILSGGAWFAKQGATSSINMMARTALTLEDVLHESGPLKESVARVLLSEIAAALHYAHNFGDGVIHCDLKPCNILLREDGHAVVTDFGIAYLQNMSENPDGNSICGTPDYMAPEQYELDYHPAPATDIYAFGVMCYRLLTGYYPVGVWERPSKFGLNSAWDKLIERCLEKKPENRWGSMAEIVDYLKQLPTVPSRVNRARRHRMWVWFGSVAIGCLVVGTGVLGVMRFVENNMKQLNARYAEAFIDGDLEAAMPNPRYMGNLIYADVAPPELPIPEFTLINVVRMGIPKQVTTIVPEFWEKFPRLEYIACHPDNKTFVALDGILYRRADMTQPVHVPPKLFGEITLPDTVERVVLPWAKKEALSATSFTSLDTGAYNQKLHLKAKKEIKWCAKEHQTTK